LYFPIINTTLPDWFPIWGGKNFVFFQPIFNIADASITTGVLIMLIFYKKVFSYSKDDSPLDVTTDMENEFNN
jgi:signal peptidase II